jgi:hypothetical protein
MIFVCGSEAYQEPFPSDTDGIEEFPEEVQPFYGGMIGVIKPAPSHVAPHHNRTVDTAGEHSYDGIGFNVGGTFHRNDTEIRRQGYSFFPGAVRSDEPAPLAGKDQYPGLSSFFGFHYFSFSISPFIIKTPF